MNDEQLQQLSRRIGEQLRHRQATVTAAESCTGGWIAKVFTDISGSSAWFERGFVTYSNEASSRWLACRRRRWRSMVPSVSKRYAKW